MEYAVQQIKHMHGAQIVFEVIHCVAFELCSEEDYSLTSTEHLHGFVNE
jgi:hypothetical protein